MSVKKNKLLFILSFLIFAVTVRTQELAVQQGHTGTLTSIAISPDGRTLASGNSDHTIKLWDLETKRELRSIAGHSGFVQSVAFSPDGKTLASGSTDETIKLWDVTTGRFLQVFRATTAPEDNAFTRLFPDAHIYSVKFSPDGKLLACGGSDGTVRLWDVASGKQIATFAGLDTAKDVFAVTFSPNGRMLAAADSSGKIKIWNVATRAVLMTLDHAAEVYSIAFSPEELTLASGGDDKAVKLWNVQSGQLLRTLTGHNTFVGDIAFNADGTILASAGGKDSIKGFPKNKGSETDHYDAMVKLWDVASGQELRTLKGIYPVAFAPNGKTLVSGIVPNRIKLWNVSSGEEIGTLTGHIYLVRSISFSPDGRTLVSGGFLVRLWNLAADHAPSYLERYFSVHKTAFSPDGQLLAIGGPDLSVWKSSSRQQLKTFNRDSSPASALAFSPDGKMLASGDYEKTVKLWDVASGNELKTLLGHSGMVTTVAFSPDGKILASGDEDKNIKLWDVTTGRELRTLAGHDLGINAIAFSPDGKLLVSAGSGQNTAISDAKNLKIWDVATGRQIAELAGHKDDVRSIAFNPNGRTFASGSTDFYIRLWDVATAKTVKEIFGREEILDVAFNPDGNILASVGRSGIIRLWDVKTGDELCALLSVDVEDWLVVAPNGLFDGSPAGWKQILWRFSDSLYDVTSVESFFSEFYYPGLLTDIIAGKHPSPKTRLKEKDIRQPLVTIAQTSAASTESSTQRVVSIKLVVNDVPADQNHKVDSGAQDVRLFRNGSLVKVWRGDVLKGQKSVTLEATVPIVAGANQFTAYAFNHDNVKSEDAALTVTGAESLKHPGTLYVLAVGVGQYANSQYNLNYTVADAQDFSDEVKRQQEQIGRYQRIEVISLLNQEATKANILAALKKLADTSQPEDAVIVYFSGHGTAQKDRFYLIPHDLGYTGSREPLSAADLQTILSHSISDVELEEAFRAVDAGQLLLVIDACNSGQALESEEKRRGPMNSRGLAQLAYEKGMYVLTASQSVELAFESEALKHSYLTFALVEEGLKTNAADKEPTDGQVFLREWFDFATERVPRLRQEKVEQSAKRQGKALELVEVTEQGKVQTPRVFYRREPDTQPLVVAKTGAAK
jgi:WD40 repeat protein